MFVMPLVSRYVPVLAIATLLLAACGGEPELAGTDLQEYDSPDFSLIDQRGEPVRMDDLRGRAVALTFIYTQCTDVCPLIASTMRLAYDQLAPDIRDRVAFVSITVDPERDTPEALRAFSARYGLADNPNWFALTGDRSDLAPVWRDYGIEPGDFLHEEDHQGAHDSLQHSERELATPEMLSHTDAIYFIDPEGRQRTLLRGDATPDAIASNLRALVDEWP